MKHHPESLAELSQLIAEIEGDTSPVQLGPTARNTLRNLIDSPAKTAISSISELADTHNINPSTLSRLAKALGFTGFSAFQKVFRNYVDKNSGYYSIRASQLIEEFPVSDHGDTAFEAMIRDESRNLQILRTTQNRESIDQAVDMVINSRKVAFFGRRQFYSLSSFMGYAMGLIRDNVELLQPIPDISHTLNFMGENDLLFVMGCDPYTRATVDACKIAQQHQIPMIAITDSPASPLAQYATHHLIVPTDGHFYSNNMAASFVMAEGLLAMVAQRMGQKAVSNLKNREKLNREFGTSFS